MKYIIAIIAFISLLGLSGCGYKEGVRTAAAKSHLYFTGDTSNVLVSIDNSEKFPVKSGIDHLYNVAPGKHLVQVYRDDKLIVKIEIFVSDGVSKEIEVR
ncbi:hypothetical protein [Sulfurimonas paralvinellae]|uniref:Lipoprotein n=1 Tax=Sulfurimonas paralvinellae TaxID=317658 RepID=A0A7M1B9X0_9BACT|nr:hypothetical protein [Sulfurimonas paralvinellae]QOP46493.1 hypothetical protein FM071_09380 [Sulfurimonas paralvinellae]